ncbi:RecX family transcriptional regulator [Paenibacillus sp. CAA11]|uniref:regulatory protein RecX n=1 Tax=Paenibacillus sp. CAA11 TaxID=1532905 RepID=UPI000D37E8B1|nr:RecX family transcriptional regulator [Paenibacillus sp. CAA11]AWB44371.1 RecX family transcriptional regulator [Paenibacillus sp. CAA11]
MESADRRRAIGSPYPSLPGDPEQLVEDVSVEIEDQGGLDAFPEDEALPITGVERLKGRDKYRYRIRFGTHDIDVHEDVMIKFRMIKGAVFTKQELEEIVLADEKQQAYAAALNYLSRKPRTQHEVTMRLNEKGWEEGPVAEVIHRLEREGLLNDALYAREWAEQRVRSRGKGKMWVRQELRQKGVSKPLIEEALGEVAEEEEYQSALALAGKRWDKGSGEIVDRKRKIAAFLMRRGFSGSIASRVVRQLADQNYKADDEVDWMC